MDPHEEALFGSSPLAYAAGKLIAGILATPVDLVNVLRLVEHRPSAEFLQMETDGSAASEEQDQDDDEPEAADDSDSDADTEVAPDFDDAAPDGKAAFAAFDTLHETAPLLKNTDAQGYLVRSGGNDPDDPTRPPFELSVVGVSTLQAMAKIVKCESEGVLSLWNGYLISWFHDISHTLLVQPSIEQSLNDLFDIRDDTIPHQHLDNPLPTLATLIGSHALSGILLSPLELVRTRIMVQTSNPYHRKYKNSIRAISQIIREEGPGAFFYMSRRFFPTILLKTLQPIFKYGTAFFVQRVLDLDPESMPLTYQLAELGCQFVELIVLLPLETVVRRLECQVVGRFVSSSPGQSGGDNGEESGESGDKSGPFEGMVRCNAIPYTDMFNCASRIILEEGSSYVSASSGSSEGPRHKKNSATKKKKKGTLSGGWFSPVSGLYRGLKLRMKL
ncbi:mitochondrial carrier domain-containing protein [Obelidium mucronatum]|nr:mitochondrial carrier domain-containing protein [Obelidium mucronatum]